GRVVGFIRKRWSGLAKELFTAADDFQLELGPSISPRLRLLRLGKTFLLEFVHFETRSGVLGDVGGESRGRPWGRPLLRRLRRSTPPRRATPDLAHPGLDLARLLGDVAGEDTATALGDEHVVLDAHADAPVLRRHGQVVHLEVEPRLDGEDHAGSELAVA